MENKQLQVSDGIQGMPEEFTVANILAQVIKERDFVVIRDSIEPRRDFMLKLFALGQLESSIVSQDIHEMKNGEVLFTVVVRVWNKSGQSESMGSCAISELEERKGGRGDFTRRYHDAFAIAETRGLKRAIEAKAGVAFINEILKHLYPEKFRKTDLNGNKRIKTDKNGWHLPEEWKQDVNTMGVFMGSSHFTDDERAQAKEQIKKCKTLQDVRAVAAAWRMKFEEREATDDDMAKEIF